MKLTTETEVSEVQKLADLERSLFEDLCETRVALAEARDLAGRQLVDGAGSADVSESLALSERAFALESAISVARDRRMAAIRAAWARDAERWESEAAALEAEARELEAQAATHITALAKIWGCEPAKTTVTRAMALVAEAKQLADRARSQRVRQPNANGEATGADLGELLDSLYGRPFNAFPSPVAIAEHVANKPGPFTIQWRNGAIVQ